MFRAAKKGHMDVVRRLYELEPMLVHAQIYGGRCVSCLAGLCCQDMPPGRRGREAPHSPGGDVFIPGWLTGMAGPL
jgi:hypothetical protein